MKIVQVLNTFTMGDAISNNALVIRDLLTLQGYDSELYTEYEYMGTNKFIKHVSSLPELDENDVLIYHLSINVLMLNRLKGMKCRKVGIYHNVTPHEFFLEYSMLYISVCKRAIYDIKSLANTFDYCIADSSFNRDDLIKYGYTCSIDVVPIALNMEDFKKEPNKSVINKYDDGRTNIVFVGRVAPNKKQQDVISAFACYKKNYNKEARLFLVGDSGNNEKYKKQLDSFVAHNGTEDVIFTEKIPFDELLAYYSIADIFLCMSAHEGFCVPLIEAMMFDVPIVAYSSCAVPETLGGAGILIEEKDSLITAGIIDKIVADKQLRDMIIENQRNRLEELSFDNLKKMLNETLINFIGEKCE
ncbi:MAG: glycosyltransferase family 4 protein [Oscillospiraceae bacterium]|nr:glycosyltransferase family 4 protein [Oscillospiraceae bacterium]